MKFIQISDIHLGSPGEKINGCDPCERLLSCLDDIIFWHSDADFCVITGDLTEFAEPAAYRFLKTTLQGFSMPTYLMLGNHDNREIFKDIFDEHLKDENGYIQYSINTKNGVFLFLDTSKEGSNVHEGQMCSHRLKWLREALISAGEAPTYIFMHHPPFNIGIDWIDKIKLLEVEQFAEIMAYGKNIKHIFFGHVHRMTSVFWRGIQFTSLPSLNHQIPLVPKSVDSKFCDDPPAYGVINISKDQLTIHFNTFMQRNRLA